MEPSFNPFGEQDDPTGSDWMSADNFSPVAPTAPSAPESSNSASLSLPPLLAPPPPQEEKDEDYIKVLEARLARVKKRKPVYPSDSDQPVHHTEIGEKEIYMTKFEAEIEPLLEESEVARETSLETDSHPRYASLANTRIQPPANESESEEYEEEAGYEEKEEADT